MAPAANQAVIASVLWNFGGAGERFILSTVTSMMPSTRMEPATVPTPMVHQERSRSNLVTTTPTKSAVTTQARTRTTSMCGG